MEDLRDVSGIEMDVNDLKLSLITEGMEVSIQNGFCRLILERILSKPL